MTDRIPPNPDRITATIGELRVVLAEIERDYARAHDEGYGLTRRGEESGRTGHSDPTADTALSRDALKATCMSVARRLSQAQRLVEGIEARLDSDLRQSDDPHARAVRAEMRDQARIITKDERSAVQAERDRSMTAELQGRSESHKRGRVLNGWKRLAERVVPEGT